jgi:hypothetical protein
VGVSLTFFSLEISYIETQYFSSISFFGFFVFILFTAFFLVNLVVAVMCESLIQVSRAANVTKEDSSVMSLRGNEGADTSPNITYDTGNLEIMMRQMLKSQVDLSKSILSIRAEIDFLRTTNLQNLSMEKNFNSMPSFVEFVPRAKHVKRPDSESRKDKCRRQPKENGEKVNGTIPLSENKKESKHQKDVSLNFSRSRANTFFSESNEKEIPCSLKEIECQQRSDVGNDDDDDDDDSLGKESLSSENDSVSQHYEYVAKLKGDSEHMDLHYEEEEISKDYVLPLDFKAKLKKFST